MWNIVSASSNDLTNIKKEGYALSDIPLKWYIKNNLVQVQISLSNGFFNCFWWGKFSSGRSATPDNLKFSVPIFCRSYCCWCTKRVIGDCSRFRAYTFWQPTKRERSESWHRKQGIAKTSQTLINYQHSLLLLHFARAHWFKPHCGQFTLAPGKKTSANVALVSSKWLH